MESPEKKSFNTPEELEMQERNKIADQIDEYLKSHNGNPPSLTWVAKTLRLKNWSMNGVKAGYLYDWEKLGLWHKDIQVILDKFFGFNPSTPEDFKEK